MDGNGRWAKERHLPRQLGHRAGAEKLHEITAAAARRGVAYLTVYAFSTENWRRPDGEVQALMQLFPEFFRRYDERLREADVRLRFSGDKLALPAEVQAVWDEAEQKSAARQGLQLIIAFNYGGRQEILQGIERLVEQRLSEMQKSSPASPKLLAEPLTEESFRPFLYLPDVPDPDLIIRTSGEMRLSNFLLWQAAYSEFYATETRWPDFTEQDLDQAIAFYQHRERRFGGL